MVSELPGILGQGVLLAKFCLQPKGKVGLDIRHLASFALGCALTQSVNY